ncbi:uncharacterized protein LOC134857274 [Symsagittifera roscoffensis]|uniref:uncharacterized protein LOC134857274 n=1 Tax=Symsagittifera roscoffensis TaxID=84072 RepID=UPI00307B5D46
MFFDLKTDGPPTYKSLYNEIFANYSDLFSSWDDNRGYKQSFLHCIITGNRPLLEMELEGPPHFCSLDNHIISTIGTFDETFSPVTSFNFKVIFGDVQVLDYCQLEFLQTLISNSRKNRKRLRFWGAPETTIFWDQLVSADGQRNVIVLNADNLSSVHNYLTAKGYTNENQGCNSTRQWCS